mmetsp:Transcript_51187/g.84898  ORF Transcript_51187/g.84898 Transcript_51187/m.84898 type:complete len:166 (+) Transcript_51187:71-568(+)
MAPRVLLWTLVGLSEAYSLIAVPHAGMRNRMLPELRRGGLAIDAMERTPNEFRFGTGPMGPKPLGGAGLGLSTDSQVAKGHSWLNPTDEFRYGTGPLEPRPTGGTGHIGETVTQGVVRSTRLSEADEFRFGTGPIEPTPMGGTGHIGRTVRKVKKSSSAETTAVP